MKRRKLAEGRVQLNMRGERRRRAREQPPAKRGSPCQRTKVAKMTELHRDGSWGRETKPSSGRKRFRVAGGLKSAGRSHGY